MSKKLAAVISTPKEAFGSDNYTINLSITNLTSKNINIVSVENQSILGLIKHKDSLIERDDSDISDYDRLNIKKRNIISELEKIVVKAYNKRISKYKTTYAYLSYSDDDYVETYNIRQALSIENWGDVERLEKEFIFNSSPDLKNIYALNKEKLKEVLEQQQEIGDQKPEKEKEEKENFKAKYIIQPGETITFPIEAVAPFLTRAKNFTFQFKISYQEPSNNIIANFSVSENFTFYPSTISIYLGAVLGGVAGFIVRITLNEITLVPFSNFYAFLYNFIGSIALALIFTAFTIRTPSSKKAITTEDFIGGFILGALVGIASNSIHSYLLKFVPN